MNSDLPQRPSLRDVLNAARRELDAPGALAVLARGDEVFSAACGVADVEQVAPVRPGQLWPAGSILKVMIGTVLLRLEAGGVFSLDDVLANWLPDIPRAPEITLRMLARHESGIHCFGEVMYHLPLTLLRHNATRRWVPADNIEIANHYPRYFEPGQGFHYSNTNYVILGEVVRLATGRELSEHLHELLWDPLGMTNTIYAATEAFQPLELRGYAREELGGVDITDAEAWSLYGYGGAILTTAADLLRFMQALHGGQLLDEAQYAVMQQTADAGHGKGYGIGVQTFRRDWGSFLGHGGNTMGYTSGCWYFPEEELQMLFCVNRGFVREKSLMQALLGWIRSR
ncbi:MAG: serine hydrolase domain-containing protein [bacterium]